MNATSRWWLPIVFLMGCANRNEVSEPTRTLVTPAPVVNAAAPAPALAHSEHWHRNSPPQQYADNRVHVARYQKTKFDSPIVFSNPEKLMAERRKARFNKSGSSNKDNTSADTSMPSTLVSPILDAHYDMDGGAALLAAIAALPPGQQQYGLSGLSPYVQEGFESQTALCERPSFTRTEELDGVQYDVRYQGDILTLTGELKPKLYSLPQRCLNALTASGGNLTQVVSATGCTAEDQGAHFPFFSACRTCLSQDGNHARCVAGGFCKDQMAQVIIVGNYAYDVLEAPVLACAPNVMTTATVLSKDLGPDNIPPKAFDHSMIYAWCLPWTDQGDTEPTPHCAFNENPAKPRLARSDIVGGFIDYIHKPGHTDHALQGRFWLANRAEIDGDVYEDFPLYPETLAPVSEPFSHGGFGLPPNELRPDGTDLNNIDDTFARDWLGALSMKITTHIAGVPIYTYNHNLCGSWSTPDPIDGHATCQVPIFTDTFQPVDDDKWRHDWGGYEYDPDPLVIEIVPQITLAASGYMDPLIPGGHLPQELGSTTLANPNWENCRWPQTFVPDEMANYETLNFTGNYTFNSQTYHFGRDPSIPIRIVVGTNWHRNFCFTGITP